MEYSFSPENSVALKLLTILTLSRVRAKYVEKCTFDEFLFTGRNFFVMQIASSNPYMFWKSDPHTFQQDQAHQFWSMKINVDQIVAQIWSSVAHSFRGPWKMLQQLVPLRNFSNLFH